MILNDNSSFLKPSDLNVKVKSVQNIFYTTSENLDSNDLVLHFNKYEYDKGRDNLILKVDKLITDNPDENVERYSTGNFIGYIKYNKQTIKINSRFGNVLLNRMIDFSNDFKINEHKIESEQNKNKEVDNIIKLVLYKSFVQALKKASFIGFPKRYQTRYHREEKIIGQIDVNMYRKKDIPFMGKISSKSNERIIDQNIIDVLVRAINIIIRYEQPQKITKNLKYEYTSPFTKTIKSLIPELKSMASQKPVNNETIQKAKTSRSLLNPMYKHFKYALHLAAYIIELKDLDFTKKSFPFNSVLINVAELWEIYMIKLLQIHFPEWIVHYPSPKIEVYGETFFNRNIIPDIVMEDDKQILVFDTKYKRMSYKGRDNYGMGDVDRNDFFQIHTYMAYYNGLEDKELLAGGLLYPIEAEKLKDVNVASILDSKTKLIIDGIHLKKDKELDLESIIEAENEFVERIKKILTTKN